MESLDKFNFYKFSIRLNEERHSASNRTINLFLSQGIPIVGTRTVARAKIPIRKDFTFFRDPDRVRRAQLADVAYYADFFDRARGRYLSLILNGPFDEELMRDIESLGYSKNRPRFGEKYWVDTMINFDLLFP